VAELKTTRNRKSAKKFVDGVKDAGRREDARKVMALMEEVTGAKSEMWGDSIVGFGSYRYKYASGREAEWMLTGFSPRKRNLTLYIMSGFDDYDALLGDLGKYKTGKSCLYINKIEDVDLEVLTELVEQSVRHMVETN